MTVGNVKFKYDGYKDGLAKDLQTSLEEFSFMETYDRISSETTEQKIRMLRNIRSSCKSLQWDNNRAFVSLESFLERSLEFKTAKLNDITGADVYNASVDVLGGLFENRGTSLDVKATKALSGAPLLVKGLGRLILWIISIVENVINFVVNFIKGIFGILVKAIMVFKTAGKNALKTPEEFIARYSNDDMVCYDVSGYNEGLGLVAGLKQIELTCREVNKALKYGQGFFTFIKNFLVSKVGAPLPKSIFKENVSGEQLLFEWIGVKKYVGDPTPILKKVRADRVKQLVIDLDKSKGKFHEIISDLRITRSLLKVMERKSDTKEEDLRSMKTLTMNLGVVLKEICECSAFSLKLLKYGNDARDGIAMIGPEEGKNRVEMQRPIQEYGATRFSKGLINLL